MNDPASCFTMKIAYITVKLPFGSKETFIIPEIKEIIRRGNDVLILPFRPDRDVFHGEAECLRAITHNVRLLSWKEMIGFLRELLKRPAKGFAVIAQVLRKSRNVKIALKNLLAVPKGFYAASLFRKRNIDHIHAHWASTPSSVAYMASCLTGIPWSFTAHRWDIAENNLLAEKLSAAVFARVINNNGKKEIADLIKNGMLRKSGIVIHMGTSIPDGPPKGHRQASSTTIMCPANLELVKGHRYLLEACRILIDRNMTFRCLIAGSGPLELDLKSMARSLRIESSVEFSGGLPHERLISMYDAGMVDIVVLPSITTPDGEKEGVPVSLMEAMAHNIPVISTNTGGIPELVEDSGILVREKDSQALAAAIVNLTRDRNLYEDLQKRGREKVLKEFNIVRNVEALLSLMQNEAAAGH